MVWGKLDDLSTFHPKVMAVGNEAWGAQCRMIAWSNAHLTDGCVPHAIAHTICNAAGVVSALLSSGLLELGGEDESYIIHDFLEYNPSKDEVEAKRQKRSAAGKKAAGVRWGKGKPSESHNRPHDRGNAPDPTRPDPTLPVQDPLTGVRGSGARARKPLTPTPFGDDPKTKAMAGALAANVPQIPDPHSFAMKLLGRWMPRHTIALALAAIDSAGCDLPDTASPGDAQTKVRIYFDAAPDRARRKRSRQSSDDQNAAGQMSEAGHRRRKQAEAAEAACQSSGPTRIGSIGGK